MASITKEAKAFMEDILAEDFLFKILRDPSIVKTEWRDLKLRLMLDDFNLKPDINKIKYKRDSLFKKKEGYWEKIESWRGAIITGSLSLKAFGLIDRNVKDVDLIVRDKNVFKDSTFLRKQDKYDNIPDLDHIGYYTHRTTNMFGSTTGEWNIEFFENKTATIIEHDGFKFHHPFEVMDKKIQIMNNRDTSGKMKDIKDFYSFLHNVNK